MHCRCSFVSSAIPINPSIDMEKVMICDIYIDTDLFQSVDQLNRLNIL